MDRGRWGRERERDGEVEWQVQNSKAIITHQENGNQYTFITTYHSVSRRLLKKNTEICWRILKITEFYWRLQSVYSSHLTRSLGKVQCNDEPLALRENHTVLPLKEKKINLSRLSLDHTKRVLENTTSFCQIYNAFAIYCTSIRSGTLS